MKKYKLYVCLSAISLLMTACGGGDSEKEPEEPKDPINTFFVNEVKPPASKQCFAGAYYRKVVSSTDVWLGIGGTVTLPQMTFDESRRNPSKPEQYLDNPSVYLGGNMGGQETDIGMSWEVIREADGSVSPQRKAFRPFMRRTAHVSGEVVNFTNAPAEAKYYWNPGDKVTISIQIVDDYKLRFIVDGAGKHFEADYPCAGYKKGNKGEFKRVNAIDQVSNEGKPVQATSTKIENSKWEESYLFRSYNGQVVKAPLHSGRFTDMRCPDLMNFTITSSEAEKKIGAEAINISGKGY